MFIHVRKSLLKASLEIWEKIPEVSEGSQASVKNGRGDMALCNSNICDKDNTESPCNDNLCGPDLA